MTTAPLIQPDPNMPPCPDWCTLLPGHPWTSDNGDVAERGHQGPDFGPYVSAGAFESSDRPGRMFDFGVNVTTGDADLTTEQLLWDVAYKAWQAAEWLKVHRDRMGVIPKLSDFYTPVAPELD